MNLTNNQKLYYLKSKFKAMLDECIITPKIYSDLLHITIHKYSKNKALILDNILDNNALKSDIYTKES